jgi:hypothetical protein
MRHLPPRIVDGLAGALFARGAASARAAAGERTRGGGVLCLWLVAFPPPTIDVGGTLRRVVHAPAAGTAPSHWRDRPALDVPKEGGVEPLVWKLRVSMLWIFLGVGQLAAILAAVLLPDVLSEVMATGEFEGMTVDNNLWAFFMIVFTLLPLAMAFLTLALRDPVNRYANGILGVLIAGSWAFDVVEHLVGGEISGGIVICGAGAIAGLLIVWHAWRWPRPAEQELEDRRPAAKPEHRAAGTA